MMEKFIEFAPIIIFFVAIVAFYFIAKNNILNKDTVAVINTLLNGVKALTDSVATAFNDNKQVVIIGKVIELLRSSVYAAENMYYNGQITKEQRKEECLKIFYDLVAASELTLSDNVTKVLDSLIAAMCEQMGHNNTN